jgi:hypothetical protein
MGESQRSRRPVFQEIVSFAVFVIDPIDTRLEPPRAPSESPPRNDDI